MKSLKYLILRQPTNLDDYIDTAKRLKPEKILVELASEEIVNPRRVLKRLIAKFSWDLNSHSVNLEKVMGICLSHESVKKQRANIDKANRNLKRCMNKIQKLAVVTEGLEKKFDYSMTFRSYVVRYDPKNVFIPY